MARSFTVFQKNFREYSQKKNHKNKSVFSSDSRKWCKLLLTLLLTLEKKKKISTLSFIKRTIIHNRKRWMVATRVCDEYYSPSMHLDEATLVHLDHCWMHDSLYA